MSAVVAQLRTIAFELMIIAAVLGAILGVLFVGVITRGKR